MAKRKWIKVPKNKRGALRNWAKQHGFVHGDGNINLTKAYAYAKKRGLTKRMRQVNFAKTLRKLNR